MLGFFVLGVNHKVCPVEIREQLFFGPAEIQTALTESKRFQAISELMILSTCNRVELYGYTETPGLPKEELLEILEKTHDIRRERFESYLYHYEGREAIRHLFRVATGLDSLVIGENEILGQIRSAFKIADELGSLRSLLYRLIEKALKVGKDVRTQTRINEGATSIPSVVAALAKKIFGKLGGQKVMVLGTGEMSTMTLQCLKDAGAKALCVISRNKEKGELIGREFGAECVAFDGWEQYLTSVDILIASTACPHPIVGLTQVKQVMESRKLRPLFLIDIAVPRNISPEVNLVEGVFLYNIDDLKGEADANLRLREKEIQAAEQLIDKAVSDYEAWMDRLKAKPTLERFEKFLQETLERELELFIKSGYIDEDQKNQVRDRICSKLMHPTHKMLKEASSSGGVKRYIEALHALFNLDDEN